MQGLCTNADDHLSLRVLLSVGEVHLLPHQTGKCQTLMVTPLQVRPQAISTITGAADRVGRRSDWLLQNWILTDQGTEVTYTLRHFDVDAFLEQYAEASLCLHIFASLHNYPGKWVCTLDEGKYISMQDLLMHMQKMFSNKCDCDAMIRTLYEVQKKEDETVEEYMLHIHDVVMVICRV